MNQMFALLTIFKQLMCFGFVVLIDEEPIDRVGAGQIEIIQNNEKEQSLTNGKQYPKYCWLLMPDRRCYENAVQYYHPKENKNR